MASNNNAKTELSDKALGSKKMAAQEDWSTCAAAANFLALSFRFPEDGALADAVETEEWRDAAKTMALACGFDLPASCTGTSCLWESSSGSGAASSSVESALRVEYTHLFVGTPEYLVSPYEGVWRQEAEGVQPLLFVNQYSMDVEKFYKACGLGHPEGKNFPLDAISTELEFIAYLASLAAGLVLPDKNSLGLEDFPGGSPAAACSQFIEKHFLVWPGGFTQKVRANARIPFYVAAADLLDSFLTYLA